MPRDGDRGASYAIVDDDRVLFRRVEYEPERGHDPLEDRTGGP